MSLKKGAFLLSSALILSACGGSDSNNKVEPPIDPTPPMNTAPIANAGQDITSVLDEEVIISGSQSQDSDGDSLTYSWIIKNSPATSKVTLSDTSSITASFTPDVEGLYTIELTVNDGQATSIADTITVTVEKVNQAPVAVAGEDRTIELGQNTLLDARNSTDTDLDALSFTWTLLSKPQGSLYSITDNSATHFGFTADMIGNYIFELIASDNESESKVQVTVTVEEQNFQPVAAIDTAALLPIGYETTLYGSYTDQNLSDAIIYSWSFLSVPDASSLQTFTGNSSYFSFYPDKPGSYIAQIIVNDGKVDSQPRTITVDIQDRVPTPFEVSIPTFYITKSNQPITVDFSRTLSPNGRELQYSSRLTSGNGSIGIGKSIITPAQITFQSTGTGTHSILVDATDGVDTAASNNISILVLPADNDVFPVIKAQKIHHTLVNETIEIDLTDEVLDIDGGDLFYNWRVHMTPPLTSPLALADTSTSKQALTLTTPGIYQFMVTVSNNADMSNSTVQAVVVYVFENTMPITADAGADIDAIAATSIALDGTASSRYEEADSVLWSITSAPYNSTATIFDSAAISTTFTPDVQGRYIVQLSLVIDGQMYSGDTKVLQITE